MWMVFWANLVSKLLFTVFSLFWRENFWWTWRENTRTPPFIFLSSHPSKHTKKKIIPIFFSKFSIHLILPPNKHTLRLSSLSNSRDTTYTTTFSTTCAHVPSCEWWSKSDRLTNSHSQLTTWASCDKSCVLSIAPHLSARVSVCNCVD